MSRTISLTGVDGLPEVGADDDLAELVRQHVPSLAEGDVVVVTSKVVSKSEGRVVRRDRGSAIEAETERVVAARGPTTIARTRQGLTLAAAGVDASNTEAGTVVLLPVDPDASARRLRSSLFGLTGRNVAVVVSDTAGRPWRYGQTDIAVGCAGLLPLDDHAGRRDQNGHELTVTAPAVVDEVAASADLVKGKVAGRPLAVVHGLQDLVLPIGSNGPGATSLVRAEDADMFVLGAREAVLAAVLRDDTGTLSVLRRSSTGGVPEPVRRLVDLASADPTLLDVCEAGDETVEVSGAPDVATAAALERVCSLSVVHGWAVAEDDRNLGVCRIVLRSGDPGP